MARIIVSAGHTKADPGSSHGDLKEADLTRAIAKKIIPHLRASGVITLSVPPDLDLSKRIEWINGTGYAAKYNDVAVEIHINDGNKTGYEFWFGGEEEAKSQKLAEGIMDTLKEDTKLPSQGIHNHTKHEYGSLAFIEQTNTISVMLECLYIDNEEDIKRLKDESFVDKMSESIAKGILKYLKIDFKKAPENTTNQSPTQQTTQENQNNTSQPPSQFGAYPPRKHMSKAEREEMIINMYQRILGRNPNQNDMNYFLNIGIDEDGLLKRMVNSQEHLDILQAAQQYYMMRTKFETQSYDITRLQVESRDKDIMVHNYKQLLHQKNQHISRLNAQLQQYTGRPGNKNGPPNSPQKKQYKGTIGDRIFHFFSRILN
jgi:hypothetical protein